MCNSLGSVSQLGYFRLVCGKIYRVICRFCNVCCGHCTDRPSSNGAGEFILCGEGWRCSSSQMTLGRTCYDFALGGARSIVMSACLLVCLSARITRKPPSQTSPNLLRFAFSPGSILQWRRSEKLCASGFMDNAIFHIMAIWHFMCIPVSDGT